MFSLKGKVALITGASGGIGRAIAIAFSQQGATVILTGTRKHALEETAILLHGPYTIIEANLKETTAPDTLIQEGIAAHGTLDILINNAGMTKDGLLMRMKDEDWQMVLDVNLTASMRLIRASLKHMTKARKGRIITITSVVAHMGNAGQTNYVATKAALTGFSKALAQEVASRHITVNCIAPGFIKTQMTDALSPTVQEAMKNKIPLNTFGAPKDVAAAAVFLASDESHYITGQTIHVNGGMVMV
jgi:3-oxoacyl-[acyl-carrier protein] reductase